MKHGVSKEGRVVPRSVNVVGQRGGMKRVCRNTVASPCGAQGSGQSQKVLPLVQLPGEDMMK